MYSGVAKTPLWVTEKLFNIQRLSKVHPSQDNFHEELKNSVSKLIIVLQFQITVVLDIFVGV